MRIVLLVVWACLLAGSGPVVAQRSLELELRSALGARPHAEARVSACVLDLTTGEGVLDENADLSLVPASAHKILTIAAALAELGPDFAFETLLATDRRNLYVIGAGDPGFGDQRLYRERNEKITADFARWSTALIEAGLTHLPGDVVIDESIFDDQWVHPSWELGDLDNWYAAPVGGLNFNDNCVDITLLPSETHGAPVQVVVEPESSLVEIVNNCRSGGTGDPILHHAHDTFEYRITGRCNKRWPFGSVSFPDPGLLFADSMRTVLARNGVVIEGT
ncbi:MAG: D-alanyl-D-alanine carboxypeptidase, partial [Phycisphaerae bacterium]